MSRVYKKIQNRKFTNEKWLELNPILLENEVIFVETESGLKVKIGDGVSNYVDIPYADESTVNEILLLKEVDKEIKEELSAISEELKKKVSANFSADDSGKVLGINSSGEVVAVESLTSDATWGQLAGSYEILEPSETENLGLKKMGYDERVDVKDLNRNFDIIDSLDADVDANTENIANIQEELSKKVSSEFSKADSGKVLGINEAGEVVAVDAPLKGNVTWGELMGIEGDVNPGETESLKLKKFDFDDEVNIEILNANYDLIDGLNNRVSNLLGSLESFEGCGSELEVQDIRNGYDGQTYATAGDAVRALGAEILDINSKLQTIDPNDLGLYQDEETGMVYPVFKNKVSINGIPLSAYGGGGGGGGSSSTRFKFRRYPTDSEAAFTIGKGSPAIIGYTFSSVDDETGELTGKGTASYYVNEQFLFNQSISQGNTEFDAAQYLKVGENILTVQVTDADGNVGKLSWTITVTEITIASTFDYSLPYEGKVVFKYTAYGDADKTVHFILDKVEVESDLVTSDGKITTREFDGLSHGLHTLEVYATANIYGSIVESNRLKYDIIVKETGKVTPIISINYNVEEVIQGELIDIPYIVYDPISDESEVTLTILEFDGDKYVPWRTETHKVNKAIQHWTTRTYPTGDIRFSVSLRDIQRSIVVKVKKFDLPIAPITNDLELYLSAEGRSNNEVDPANWEYKGITTTFHNVNWASSGWVKDENGDTCLRLMGGSSATINFQPFKSLGNYGKTLEFEFAIRNVNNRGANVISCKSEDGVGFEITADAARLFSKALTPEKNKIECRFGDERKMRVAFTISSRQEYRLATVYIDGVTTHVTQYTEDDNWDQFNPVNIEIGSPYCCVDLYTVRIYSDALGHENIINNYICDLPDINNKREEYNKNDLYDNKRNILYDKVKNKIPVMTIIGPLPKVKGDKKEKTLVDYYDPNDKDMNFTGKTCTLDIQGTSSQGYRVKNYKLKFDKGQQFAHIKGGIATRTYCMKADYAEGTSTHNTGIANLAHTLYSEPIPPQEKDPRCRTTIQGFPCVIFHKETVDDAPRFVGKYNFNYDKGSEEAFGFTEEYDVESWEFCNNDELACNFLADILPYYKEVNEEDNSSTGWCKAFERRYPDHDEIDDAWKTSKEDANKAIDRFRLMHAWVVSTKDWDLSQESMLRKYREEFQEIFSLHYVLVYYVWTFFFLMVDQRAKNMFMTYWGETGKWYPYLYDNDTCLGINNEGRMVFDYYHEDSDSYFTEEGLETKVYNGQDSTLWVKFRQAFAPEIKACYQQLRNDGKITKEKVIEYFVTNQSDKWAAAIYNEDSDYKYIAPVRFTDEQATETDPKTNAYLYQVRGTGEHHLEYFLGGRINYCDSKWDGYGYLQDKIILRINKPTVTSSVTPSPNLTITPFSKMYAGVQYNANNPTIQKVLLDKNQTHTFIASEDNLFNDTDTYIYGASQISSIGDLAPTYCHYCDISKAIKLIDFKIGSEDPNYASHLTEILFGPNTLLKKIDIRNCRSFKNNPDISGCTSIEEIYAQGSNISNITLPPSGYIRKMYLPSTMVMFKIKNQQFIEDFVMESYSNLQEIIIENTPNLPIADILLAAKGLQRLRLINITWDTNKEDLKTIIDKIKSIKTFDENGYPSESKPIITGMVNVKSIDESLLREINDLFPELMVCVNGIVLCTVTYYNANGERLAIRTVNQGEDAPDIAKEKEPVMADTDLYRYKYKGWDKPLTNIQKSCSFVAMYETLYNVRYFVDGQVKHNVFAEYGSNVRDPISTNDMPVPTKESDAQFHYTFADWSEETTYVTAPIDVHAIFSTELRSYEVVFCDEYGSEITRVTCYYGKVPTYQGLTPVKQDVKYPQDYKFLGWIPELAEITGPTTYKANFADSDHILDSWATVSASVANGTYKTKYPLGVLHRVELKDGQLIDVELVAYDNGISKSGKTTALTFMAKNCLKEFMAISNDKDYNKLGWINSPVREELNQNVFNNLFPDDLKKLVVCTINTTRRGGVGLNCNDPIETEDYLWLPSVVQVRKDYYGKDCYAIEGKTFDYFDTDFDSQEIKDRRVRYKYDKTESVHCYLRTPTDNQTIYNYFYIDGRGETSAYTTCSSAKGIIPTFSIGEI